MKNHFIIYLDLTKTKFETLKLLGYEHIELGFTRINFSDEDQFNKMKPIFEEWGVRIKVVSHYSKGDEQNSPFLAAMSSINPFYPMPDDGQYKELTYDLTNYNEESGTGLVQKSPFRIKSEPKWSSNKLFELYWVRDEFFVHPDIYESIFKPLGMGCWPVLKTRKEIVLDTVVQLKIPETSQNLKLDGYDYEDTPNGKRYELLSSGFFPDFQNEERDFQIFKTKEYFGTGAESFKYIMITQSLRKRLIDAKLKLIYIPQAPKNINSSIQ